MPCPRCQHENRPQATFCEECAGPLNPTTRAYADLKTEVEGLRQALTEAREQRTAAAEILRAISASPTDVQPVFDAIVRSAVRLCGGVFSIVLRYDGELIHFVAHHNFSRDALTAYREWFPRRATADRLVGRAILECRVMNVPDVTAEYRFVPGQREQGFRSVLFVPMLRDGLSIGVIGVSRTEIGAFPESQVAHLQAALRRYAEELRRTHGVDVPVRVGLNSLYRRTGDHAKASDHLVTASTMYREMGMAFWLEKADAELGGVER